MTEALPLAELALRFESIGAQCEFGIVQRCFGSEPLGLFRFTASSIDSLTSLLDSSFAGFLTAEDLGLEIREQEYTIFSRRFADVFAHTHIKVEAQDAATVAARETKKAAYLKSRFQLDWQAAARIYVHYGSRDEAAILRLHAALRRRSDCVLFWVVVAEHAADRGRVEVRGAGLLKGYLGHPGGFDEGSPRLDLPAWARICRSAEAIGRGLPEAPPFSAEIIPARFAVAPTRWGTVAGGDTMGRCRILYDSTYCVPAAEVTVTAHLARKSVVAVSVWIRLSRAFRGETIVLTPHHADPLNYHIADMTLLDTWQQVWAVMKLSEQREEMRLTLDVEASRSSDFVFSGWLLQAGGVPDESLRPDERIPLPEADATIVTPPGPSAGPGSIMRWIALLMRSLAGRLDPLASLPASSDDDTAFDFLRLANTLIEISRYDEADAVLVAAKSLYPWRAELFTHYALCAQRRRNVAQAAARWNDVVTSFPQYALSHYRLAAALRELGETERALGIIERALPAHGDDVGMVAEAARVYATLHRWPEALAQWDRALAMANPTSEWRDARAHAVRMAAVDLSAPAGHP